MSMPSEFEKIASEAALKHLNSEANNAVMAMGPLSKMLFSFYKESVKEGFTPEQALQLTSKMMIASIYGDSDAKKN